MPQASPELNERWSCGVGGAINFLIEREYTFGLNGNIAAPPNGVRDEQEDSALWYLVEEWDFSTNVEATI